MMESALDFTRGVRTCSAVVFEVFAVDGAPDTDAADAVARRAVFTDIIRARVGAVARRDMRGGLWTRACNEPLVTTLTTDILPYAIYAI
jgi:hypothetical protein